jgi:hypothetical protein
MRIPPIELGKGLGSDISCGKAQIRGIKYSIAERARAIRSFSLAKNALGVINFTAVCREQFKEHVARTAERISIGCRLK